MASGENLAAARRYAEAAFELGDESGTLDLWAEQLAVLGQIAGDAGAVAVLENAKTPVEERSALLDRALAGMSPLVRNFARLLLTRKRLALLPGITRVFESMMDERNGVVRAQVTTAVPLAPEDQESVSRRLQTMTGARSVRLELRVDPAIIGGLVARVGDQLIDGSTRSRLIDLKKSLAGRGG